MLKATIAAAALVPAILLSPVRTAEADGISVMSALGIMAVMEELGPKFERASGNKLAITFETFTGIVKRVQNGETADIFVIPRQGIDGFVKAGKASAGNVTELARSGIGLAVRERAAKPDISSPDALKRALLAARSFAYPNPAQGGPTGTYIHRMLERLGIANEMKSKTVFPKAPGGAAIGDLVASGQAEIGVHQFQELVPIAGIEVVGWLPSDLRNTLLFAAAVMHGAKNAAASKALIDFLRTPEAAAVIKAKGMEPV
jgi:molybdate transport system substrate-binding protein